jgi:hypothetical protein
MQKIDPLICNERDRRTWAWVIEQVGEERAMSVELAGGRKAYPTNIAKALGLKPPSSLALASKTTSLQKIEVCKAVLRHTPSIDKLFPKR